MSGEGSGENGDSFHRFRSRGQVPPVIQADSSSLCLPVLLRIRFFPMSMRDEWRESCFYWFSSNQILIRTVRLASPLRSSERPAHLVRRATLSCRSSSSLIPEMRKICLTPSFRSRSAVYFPLARMGYARRVRCMSFEVHLSRTATSFLHRSAFLRSRATSEVCTLLPQRIEEIMLLAR